EKITVYNELKSEGNSLFTHNHFDLAIEKYLQALEACDDQEKWRSVLYHNISSSYLKLV
ncbi:MAG: Mitochondrial import receptor subunit TOM70, partial [Marteilia pararefringens]